MIFDGGVAHALLAWAAFARTGQYTMKLYREEVRPVVDVVLDASELDADPSRLAMEARTTSLFGDKRVIRIRRRRRSRRDIFKAHRSRRFIDSGIGISG